MIEKWRQGTTSSPHGLYELGYRCTTMKLTIRCFYNSIKSFLVRIDF